MTQSGIRPKNTCGKAQSAAMLEPDVPRQSPVDFKPITYINQRENSQIHPYILTQTMQATTRVEF